MRRDTDINSRKQSFIFLVKIEKKTYYTTTSAKISNHILFLFSSVRPPPLTNFFGPPKILGPFCAPIGIIPKPYYKADG